MLINGNMVAHHVVNFEVRVSPITSVLSGHVGFLYLAHAQSYLHPAPLVKRCDARGHIYNQQ